MSKPVSIYLYTCGSGRFAHTLRYMSAYRAGMPLHGRRLYRAGIARREQTFSKAGVPLHLLALAPQKLW